MPIRGRSRFPVSKVCRTGSRESGPDLSKAGFHNLRKCGSFALSRIDPAVGPDVKTCSSMTPVLAANTVRDWLVDCRPWLRLQTAARTSARE